MTPTIGKYILDEHRRVAPCNDLLEWEKWMQTEDRIIAKTMHCNVRVSTVFLGLDHSFEGELLTLFETMIFGGKHNAYQKRYTTLKEAEEGHKVAVALVASAFVYFGGCQ